MAHTKDPWIKGETGDSIISLDPEAIKAEDPLNIRYYGGTVIAESVHSFNQPIIIAAPEMYEALKMARDLYYSNSPSVDPEEILEMIEAALAKAEGREV